MQLNSPMFLAKLGSVRRQLIASFSAVNRNKVNRPKSRILIGISASIYVHVGARSPPKRVVQALHQAFIDQPVLEI